MKNWADSEIEYVLRTYKQPGYSASMIAANLGGRHTRDAIIGLARRLGLSSRRSHNGTSKQRLEKQAKIVALRHKGLSHGEIARVMGLPRGSVSAEYCFARQAQANG